MDANGAARPAAGGRAGNPPPDDFRSSYSYPFRNRVEVSGLAGSPVGPMGVLID